VAQRSLREYEAKRDFETTPEPRGAATATGSRRFVIQQHDATRLHWDLRLEDDGVLLSWALPRGLPLTPDRNHLAVHTEDHPIEYLTFEGDIPEGEYGAGRMFVWDRGEYEPSELTDTKLVVTLRGERTHGRYALFRTRGRDWMIHRMDPPEDPDHQPAPLDWRPMEAQAGRLPGSGDWWFEVLLEGRRALVRNLPGEVTIISGNGDDLSDRFPEVRRIGRHLGSKEVLLDGVLTSATGHAETLERRLTGGGASTIRRLARDQPATFVAFDLLWRDGYPTIDAPLEQRLEQLEGLALDGPAWQGSRAHRGDGEALLSVARSSGLPGLVAKRAGSRYRPGTTSRDWRCVDTSA